MPSPIHNPRQAGRDGAGYRLDASHGRPGRHARRGLRQKWSDRKAALRAPVQRILQELQQRDGRPLMLARTSHVGCGRGNAAYEVRRVRERLVTPLDRVMGSPCATALQQAQRLVGALCHITAP